MRPLGADARAQPDVTKSISSSTRPSKAGSRSAKRPHPRRGSAARPARCRPGRRAASRAPRRCRASTRSSAARRATPSMPSRPRLDGLPDVDERVPDDEHVSGRAGRGDRPRRSRLSFEPGTRWSTSTPTRRCGPGRNSREHLGEVVDALEVLDDDALDPQVVSPRPSRPARRRAGPRRRCGSARATRACAPSTANEPEAVRRGPAAPPAGTRSGDGLAVDQERPGRAGRPGTRPFQSSSSTVPASTRTIAPVKP